MDRDALIVENLDLVEIAVAKLKLDGTNGLDREDLVGIGNIALVEASRRFDTDRKVPFRAYAYRRIWRAIIDDLRDGGFVHRTAYARGERATIASLETPIGETRTIGDTLESRQPPVEEIVEQRERIFGALTTGSDRDREIMARRANGQSDSQIAEALGVTEGRICQIAKEAHGRHLATKRAAPPIPKEPITAPPAYGLTHREMLVLHGAAYGETNQATASRLQRSIETIKAQRREVIRKLRARNIVHAVLLASPHLLTLPPL